METKAKPEKIARPRPVRPERPARKPAEPGGKKFWGMLQGDVVELVESAERPDLTVKPGERMKKILFSTPDQERANKLFADWKSRAKGKVGKGVAY